MIDIEQWFSLRRKYRSSTIVLRGELDLCQADELAGLLHEECIRSGLRKISIDLSQVDFIDVRIGGVLLAGLRAAEAVGIGCTLVGMNRPVGIVLRMLAPDSWEPGPSK